MNIEDRTPEEPIDATRVEILSSSGNTVLATCTYDGFRGDWSLFDGWIEWEDLVQGARSDKLKIRVIREAREIVK